MANEKRLIPLQKRIIYAGDVFNSLMSEKGWSVTETADFVKAFRTVDAVEVVHGHMVERIVDHECRWYKVLDCSECGCSIERWHNYCPNCGAKMDGDGDG